MHIYYLLLYLFSGRNVLWITSHISVQAVSNALIAWSVTETRWTPFTLSVNVSAVHLQLDHPGHMLMPGMNEASVSPELCCINNFVFHHLTSIEASNLYFKKFQKKIWKCFSSLKNSLKIYASNVWTVQARRTFSNSYKRVANSILVSNIPHRLKRKEKNTI